MDVKVILRTAYSNEKIENSLDSWQYLEFLLTILKLGKKRLEAKAFHPLIKWSRKKAIFLNIISVTYSKVWNGLTLTGLNVTTRPVKKTNKTSEHLFQDCFKCSVNDSSIIV